MAYAGQLFCLSYGVIRAARLITLDCVLPMEHKHSCSQQAGPNIFTHLL